MLKKLLVIIILLIDIVLFIIFPILIIVKYKAYSFLVLLFGIVLKRKNYKNLFNLYYDKYSKDIQNEVNDYIKWTTVKVSSNSFYRGKLDKRKKDKKQELKKIKNINSFVINWIIANNLLLSTWILFILIPAWLLIIFITSI